jgi:hypothetical protein
MQYMLLIYDEEAVMNRLTPDELGSLMGAFGAYTQAVRDAGVLVSSNRLQSVATATTVRGEGAASQILDGPFAETKEQLGGYYLIEAPDLDAALDWAKKCPGARYGCVEVRPIYEMSAG